MDIVVWGSIWARTLAAWQVWTRLTRVVLRRRMRRSSVESFINGLGRCTVAMEACCGAHRVFAAEGHSVRLMSPEYVRPALSRKRGSRATR